MPIKKSQVSNILRKLGFRFKKETEICKRTKSNDIKQQREKWKKEQKFMTAKRLVFLDESSVNINMTRHYGEEKEKKEFMMMYL